MNKKGRISLVFLLLVFILCLIFIPFNSEISAASSTTSSECASGKGYGVRVALDPEHIEQMYALNNFKPNEITPYDDINCNVWVKKECDLTVQNIKTKLVVGESESEIISNSSIPFSKNENNTDIYRWKVEGYNWSEDKYQSPYVGWINNKRIMKSVIDQGNATCIANITFDNGDSPAVNDTFDISTCLQMKGDGVNDFVFALGFSTGYSLNYFLNLSHIVHVRGFEGYDPFSSRMDRFSFYADLKEYNDFDFNMGANNQFDYDTPQLIYSKSSCKPAKNYIFYNARTSKAYANQKISFMDPSRILNNLPKLLSSEDYFAQIAMHEFGHSFCGLADEYYTYDNDIPGYVKVGAFIVSLTLLDFPNCNGNPDWSSSTGDYFNSCFVSRDYVRSSYNSLMRYGYRGSIPEGRFNVVSCGYCLKEIEGIDSAIVNPGSLGLMESYWQQCSTMNTVKPIGVDERNTEDLPDYAPL